MSRYQFREAGAGHHDIYVLYRKPDFVRYLGDSESDEVIRRLEDENQRLSRMAEQFAAQIKALHGSSSWKATAPLRMLSRALKARFQ